MHRRGRGILLLVLAAVTAGPEVASAGDGPEGAKPEFPDSWYYYRQRRPARLRRMEGEPAPALTLTDWIGERPELRDKVVVVEFWATWCAPCVASIPKNRRLIEEFGDRGMAFVAVHQDHSSWKRVPDMIRRHNIDYPVARDRDGVTARDWSVSFWPSYFIIDRDLVVRAAGLAPSAVERAVRIVLESPVDEDDWGEGTPDERRRLESLCARPAPPEITADECVNGGVPKLETLAGKVVLLVFWNPAEPASVLALDESRRLHDRFAADGLVVVAVSRPPGVGELATIAERLEIGHPLCVDAAGTTLDAYQVDSYPDYYLIDRAGALRVADCRDSLVEEAVTALLAEDRPVGPPDPG